MKTCKEYVEQYIKLEPIGIAKAWRYGRTGTFAFKKEWDNNVEYWGPLIVRVMQKHLAKEWKLYGNKSTTSSHKLIDNTDK